MSGILVGSFLLALPQCFINNKYVNAFSPKVYTEQLFSYSNDLQAWQVYMGITIPRYETYVGDLNDYPTAGVRFEDEVGQEIIEREGLTETNFTLSNIFKLFYKYPLDIIGIYTRHLVSSLTPLYDVYISDLYIDKSIMILLAILIWIISALGIFSNNQMKKSYSLGYMIALIVPAILQLLGAVEIRFCMPLYILAYWYVACEINYSSLAIYFKKNMKCILFTCCLIMIMWISTIGMILADNQQKVFLINDYL